MRVLQIRNRASVEVLACKVLAYKSSYSLINVEGQIKFEVCKLEALLTALNVIHS